MGANGFVPIGDESMCYNGHTWPTNLSTTLPPCAYFLHHTLYYARNVFPINVTPPTCYPPFKTTAALFLLLRKLFTPQRLYYTIYLCIYIRYAWKISASKNFLTLWLQTFFFVQTQIILKHFLYKFDFYRLCKIL